MAGLMESSEFYAPSVYDVTQTYRGLNESQLPLSSLTGDQRIENILGNGMVDLYTSDGNGGYRKETVSEVTPSGPDFMAQIGQGLLDYGMPAAFSMFGGPAGAAAYSSLKTAGNTGEFGLDALKSGAMAAGATYLSQNAMGYQAPLSADIAAGAPFDISTYNPDLGGANNYSNYQNYADQFGDVSNYANGGSYFDPATYGTLPDPGIYNPYSPGLMNGPQDFELPSPTDTIGPVDIPGQGVPDFELPGATDTIGKINLPSSSVNYGKLIKPALSLLGGTAANGSFPGVSGGGAQSSSGLLSGSFDTTPAYLKNTPKTSMNTEKPKTWQEIDAENRSRQNFYL
jgi:hypothetical protein